MKFLNNKKTKGFTLIEIMVSVAIFTVIITTGMGALVSLLRSYEVTQSQKRVNDGINYAFETMTREIRLGHDYYQDPALSGTIVGGNDGEGTALGFDSSDNRGYIRYYVSNGALTMTVDGGTPNTLTDNTQITIEDIRFIVLGTAPYSTPDLNQPLVWMQIKASAVGSSSDRTTTVQTLVSQRVLDF